jgi:threonine dehydrogenase-like Zn-dependent dehydrogenase
MKANVWEGRNDVQIENVPDPKILNRDDAIVQITSTAICGSDLHLYDGFIPTMKRGDILGHEFMGRVTDVGPDVERLKVGDRVVVPFPIACGKCNMCAAQLWSCCENSNPNAGLEEKVLGKPIAGIYGYSHMMGGFAGGQAEAARVPFADVGPIKIEDDLPDRSVLGLADAFATGYYGAEAADIERGDVVAIWGCGPVGQYSIASAKKLLGAERVIAIDGYDYRLEMALHQAGADEVINFKENPDVVDQLTEMTGGRGPDRCIDAVGLEADHGHGGIYAYDRVKQAAKVETDRPYVIRQCIMAVRNGGTVSMIGAYGGFIDKFPIGALMNRSITIKTGQCHVHRYMEPLLQRIRNGDIDPSFVFTHEWPLDRAPDGYEHMKHKLDGCVKVMLHPESPAV